MHFLSYVLSIVACITTNLKWNQSISFCYKGEVAVQTLCNMESETTNEQDMPADSLDEILKKETHSGGAIQNILGGLALCYNVLTNLLLYPIFSFLLLLLSIGAIVLGVLWIKKIKNEKSISTRWILCTCLYLLLYLDLFLVVHQKKKILLLMLELEKDLFLIIAGACIGYVVGKFFSSKFFEEKELP
ncbi:membrane protein of unknown function [Cardinium endosymbiont cEper1 of Encarsia pergandiella]|uniref:hypothetical protein n=1 Tax=Cardinium endosymbiont of Encarsia pergandiella TaxID=249402 RepID=UPI00027EA8D8|nr:hypothetical protein [Cardinium endosymbiont of Encarsia pergandiella]CCM09820.1 membrane protein of unknown function [Cardinium endosymbiont cEper1 of Encarsia pergandiella]